MFCCYAEMQGGYSVCPRLPHYGGLGSAHGVGVGLLDMPFVQPGQAHGDTLAAEGHTAFQQRFAAGMERPRPGQGRAQLVEEDTFVATLAPLASDPAVQTMIIDETTVLPTAATAWWSSSMTST